MPNLRNANRQIGRSRPNQSIRRPGPPEHMATAQTRRRHRRKRSISLGSPTCSSPTRIRTMSRSWHTRILDLSPSGHVVIHHDLASEPLPWRGRPPEQGSLCRPTPSALGGLVDRGCDLVHGPLRIRRSSTPTGSSCFPANTAPSLTFNSGRRRRRRRMSDAFVDASPLPDQTALWPIQRGRQPIPGPLPPPVGHYQSTAPRRSARRDSADCGVCPATRYRCLRIEYSHRRKAWFIGSPRRRGRPSRSHLLQGEPVDRLQPSRSAETVLNTDPSVTEWFMQGHIPDETYLQSVLYNAPELTREK